MEHIVQFGIGIDDKAIVDAVMKNAEKSIIEDLNKKVKENFFEIDSNWYSKPIIKGVQPWVEDKFNAFLVEHKDEIIRIATDKLADKLSRSKTVREAIVNEVKEK